MSGFLRFLQGDDQIEIKPKEKDNIKNNIKDKPQKIYEEEKIQRVKKAEKPKTEKINIKKNVNLIDKDSNNYLSLIRPESFEDVELAIIKLTEKKEILVDFEGRSLTFIQRMLDFISGAVFAYNGTIKKIGKQYRYHIKL